MPIGGNGEGCSCTAAACVARGIRNAAQRRTWSNAGPLQLPSRVHRSFPGCLGDVRCFLRDHACHVTARVLLANDGAGVEVAQANQPNDVVLQPIQLIAGTGGSSSDGVQLALGWVVSNSLHDPLGPEHGRDEL